MNILILHKSLVLGGTEKILLNYLNILSRQHQATLLLTIDLGEQAFFQDGIPAGVAVHTVFSEAEVEHYSQVGRQRRKSLLHKIRHEYFKAYEQIRFYRAVKRLIRQNQIDLIIDFSGCLDKFIRLPEILRRGCPPSVRWVHGRLHGLLSSDKHQFDKFRKIFQNHAAVIALCPQMSEYLQNLFTLPPDKIRTLPNPMDLADIAAQAEQDLPAEAAAYRPYILQTARLDIGKGHEELIDIYAELKRRGITHKLCFVGEGGNRTALEAKIRALGLEQDCIVLGAHRNPYPFFKHADVFVHTSEHEGLPTVLLESMACGTPVVAMDCPTGPKDVLGANSEYGRLIPLHDKQAFADAVCELLASPEQQSRYRKQGLRRVRDFSVENIGLQLEALLNSLTGKKQP
ncbi:glycosyltransferase [Conchiformibius kuhniae]|uniref:Glycosyltransferase n=1 Tax=Conchiformibius kuhniae TaxID=211502 RepID=A0A8T9MV42_9NEIS|nr:glycosyltransferase [Conchiformibius kuhniae]